jgi:hypothetical protein
MGRLRFGRCAWLVSTIFLFLFIAACGGHKPPGVSPFPAKVTLNPNPSYSMQLGTTLVLTASAQNGSGSNVRSTFTYAISPTSPAGIVDIAPNGFACAGTWNSPAYTICTPGNTGVVEVTASALGATSAPTYIFVHAPIDNIQVSVVPPVNSPPPACPNQQALPPACNLAFNGNASNYCLSQNQVQTLQATAYSQGTDITAQVGPFTWTEVSPSVVKVTPFVTVTSYNVPTNQATAAPSTPGQTEVIASASGVYSQPFNFEACPVQCIAMQLSVNGQYTNQTSFAANKGTSETLSATAVDVQGCIVPKPALTWVSSAPAVISTGSSTSGSGSGSGSGTTNCGTGTTCAVSTPQPGAAAITASCTPPTCNIGFPLNLADFPPPYIPQPVYPVTAISGLVTGTPTSTGVLSTSHDCYGDQTCAVALYSVSTVTNLPGSPNQLPTPPNSMMFDAAGSLVFMGSEFGAFSINPSGFGGSTSPFTPLPAPGTTLGLVTGKVLAVYPSGTLAVFSDTVSTPNQVYLVSSSPQSTTALNINSATASAISPDGLETLILGNGGNTLYAYSTLQYVQTVQPNPLPTPATSIAFNSTGSFALLSGGSPVGSLAIYNTCNNSLTIPYLSAPGITTPPLFLKMVPAGNVALDAAIVPVPLQTAGLDFFFGLDNTGIDIIATTSSQPVPTAALCPQPITLAETTAKTPFAPVHINLNQGTFQPIDFFLSPNATQAYIVTTDQGVLVYDFNTSSVTRIQLLNDATPIAADMTVDGTLIYVAGSDGQLHQLNTLLGVDLYQTSFVPLPNSQNSFCFTGENCALNIVAVKP